MRNLRRGTKFFIFILLFLFFIVGYQVQQQVKIMKQPPSKKWGKEIYISSGKISRNMQLIKYGGNYVLLHNDDFNFKVILFDSLGNVIKEKTIKSQSMSEIYDFALNLKNNIIILNAVTEDDGIACLKTFKLNDNLEIISSKKSDLSSIAGFHYIDENVFVTSTFANDESSAFPTCYNHNINIYDCRTDKVEKIELSMKIDEVTGIEIDHGYIIVYHGEDNFFYYFTYNNGEVSEPKPFLEYKKGITFSYEQPVLASDNNNFYLMFQKIKQGGYNSTLLTQVNLKNNQVSQHDFKRLPMNNVKGFASQDGATYIYTSPFNNQVVDMTIKDGQIVEKSFVSRLAPLNINSYVCDEVAVFAKFERTDFYNVYVSSTGGDFKIKNNTLRKVDIKMALQKELKGLLNVIIYIFLLGTTWFLPLFAVASIYSSFSYKLANKNKIKSYVVFSIMGIIYKTLVVFNHYYADNLISYGILMNSILGVIISAIISISIYGYYFYKYTENTEGIFVIRLLPPLLLDTIITLILFVPFTI